MKGKNKKSFPSKLCKRPIKYEPLFLSWVMLKIMTLIPNPEYRIFRDFFFFTYIW